MTGRLWRQSGQRGGTLPITLGVVAILAVLILALQFQGSAARSALLASEARFQAEVSAQNALVLLQQGLSGDPVAGAPALSPAARGDDQALQFACGLDPFSGVNRSGLYVDADTRLRPVTGFGGKVFANPDLGLVNSTSAASKVALNGRTVDLRPFLARADFRPASRDRSLAAAGPRDFEAVLQAGFPYGAYAPNGSISLTSAASWVNDPWSEVTDDEDPVSFRSGVPVRLGARSNITVQEAMAYGEARVSNTTGRVQVTGGAVGFVGRPLPPGADYAQGIRSRAEAAFSLLQARAFDKTGLLFGRPLSKPTDWFDLVARGKRLDNFFTYEQATNFWFMVLPQINAKGTIIDVKLHLPLAPDQAPPNPGTGQKVTGSATAANELLKVDEDLDKVKSESTALEGVIQGILDAKAALEQQKTDKSAQRASVQGAITTLQGQVSSLESQLAGLEKQDPKPTGQIDSVKSQIDSLKSQISAKQAQVTALDTEIAQLDVQIAERQKELDGHKAQAEELDRKRDTLEKQRDKLASQIKDNGTSLVEGYLGFPGQDLGPDRKGEKKLDESDKLYKDGKGQTGWSYYRLLKKLFGALWNAVKKIFSDFPTIRIRVNLWFVKFTIILPDVTKIPAWLASLPDKFLDAMLGMLEDLVTETVTLVHLGHDGPALRLTDPSTFVTNKGFTVPAGRTFRLRRNLQVNQNVWVQKGACLVVDQNLDILGDPKEYVPVVGSLLQTGILFLEEGATVVVGGNLNANQVTIAGPGGKVRGLTSAILCKGNVVIHNGTKPGISLPDLFAYLFDSKATGDALEVFVRKVAPNLAKLPVLGPFHARKPYFSSYPTAFRIIIVPPAPPVVYPTFEPVGTNVNNTLFKALSYFFAVHLNLTLGDNFMTASDFWKIGENRVPILPKALSGAVAENMKGLVQQLKGLFDSLLGLSLDDVKRFVEDAVDDVAKVFLSKHLPELLVKVGTTMLLSFVPFGDLVAAGIQPILDEIFKAIGQGDGFAASLGIAPGTSPAAGALRQIDELVADKNRLLFAEVPGVLVYAGGRLDVESGSSITVAGQTVSVRGRSMATGMFVAGGTCNIQAEYLIGSAMSLTSDVRARRLLYYPPYTRASLYLPKDIGHGGSALTSLDSFWENSVRWQYGSDLDSGESFDIPEKPAYFPLVRSWQR